MNSYEIKCVVEEISNLHFLRDKNIVPTSVNISLKTQRKALFKQNKLPYISHLPIMNCTNEIQLCNDMNDQMNELISQNKDFDYLNWRNSCLLPTINTVLDIPIYLTEKTSIFNDDKFGKIYTSNNIIQELEVFFLEIKYPLLYSMERFQFYDSFDMRSYCVELPCSKSSVILLSNADTNIERFIYAAHEIGHALFNSMKYDKRVIVPIEIDEIAAHLLELFIVRLILKEDNILDYYKLDLKKRLVNNLVYTKFQMELYKNPQMVKSNREKDILLKKIAKLYHINNVDKQCWSQIPNLLDFPFYSGAYIFPQVISLSILKEDTRDVQKIFLSIINFLDILTKKKDNRNLTGIFEDFFDTTF
ncbi:hypothetical protein [Candidatus Enterococcus lemimoniae]|uniref:IrrE N-terminal-like domain-containing protein n=1 Tax=Candidatus Enterococcus lemimoniae TaxID=1834167 RepID=A0ABZ2TAV9_9ENTE